MSVHVTPCRCCRGSCENVILARTTRRIGTAYRTEPSEAVVAVSYQFHSMLPYPAFLPLVRWRRWRVVIETCTGDYNTTLILPITPRRRFTRFRRVLRTACYRKAICSQCFFAYLVVVVCVWCKMARFACHRVACIA